MVAYAVLFASWLPFLLVVPWARRRHGLTWIWLSLTVGVAGAVYTAVTLALWPTASIRPDLVAAMLLVLFTDTAGVVALLVRLLGGKSAPLPSLGRALAWGACVLASLFLLLAVGRLVQLELELADVVARSERRRELLAEAELRDREAEPREADALRRVGTFSVVEELPSHRHLVQLELWRGDGELHGVFLDPAAGRGQRTLVFPVHFTARLGPSARFSFRARDRDVEGELLIQEERVVGVIVRGASLRRDDPALHLRPGAGLEDPVLELVPTSSREDWQEWMETVVELSSLQWRAREGGSALIRDKYNLDVDSPVARARRWIGHPLTGRPADGRARCFSPAPGAPTPPASPPPDPALPPAPPA